MKSFAAELLLVLSVAACSSSGEGEPAIDAAVGVDAPPPIDAPPSARNDKAMGAWTVTTHMSTCGGFDEGLVGTALPNDNQFQLVLNQDFPDGSSAQTTCMFSTDTDFTCANINKQVTLGACVIAGGFSNIQGKITGTAFELSGNGSRNASAQCPGGVQACPSSLATASGTIAP